MFSIVWWGEIPACQYCRMQIAIWIQEFDLLECESKANVKIWICECENRFHWDEICAVKMRYDAIFDRDCSIVDDGEAREEKKERQKEREKKRKGEKKHVIVCTFFRITVATPISMQLIPGMNFPRSVGYWPTCGISYTKRPEHNTENVQQQQYK